MHYGRPGCGKTFQSELLKLSDSNSQGSPLAGSVSPNEMPGSPNSPPGGSGSGANFYGNGQSPLHSPVGVFDGMPAGGGGGSGGGGGCYSQNTDLSREFQKFTMVS